MTEESGNEHLAGVNRQAARHVPTEEDWGDYSTDFSMKYSHRRYFGKTHEDINNFLQEFPTEVFEDLYHMPPIPFQYYILGFEILRTAEAVAPKAPDNYDNYSDIASCFLSLVNLQLREKSEAIMPIMKDMLCLADFTAAHQESYQASVEIYGSFEERVDEIKQLYEALLRDGQQ